MTRKIRSKFEYLLGFAILLLLPHAAYGAGELYTGFNNTGTAVIAGTSLCPPSFRPTACPQVLYYKVSGGSTQDSLVFNYQSCNSVVVEVYQSHPSVVGDGSDIGRFFFVAVPDLAKTYESRRVGDINGDGVINSTDANQPLDGDDGQGTIDNDGTPRQSAALYGLEGRLAYLDNVTAPGAGPPVEEAHVVVICK